MALDDLGLDIPDAIKRELEIEFDGAKEDINKPLFNHLLAGSVVEETVLIYRHILNNFPYIQPKGGIMRANLEMIVPRIHSDDVIRRHVAGSDHSELYLSRTWNEFFAEVDAAISAQENSPEEVKDMMKSGNFSAENYPEGVKTLYKAYVTLRIKGYSWLDLAK